ncbi:DNA methyltransferase [Allochromatium warmingii]|uniref:DNA methyltransferase n=1 Tax=Allochromatium warmingii TaxID=61595 RepID=UPI00268D5315
MLGLEVNEFAAELARVTVWIGDIQWCRRNKYEPAMNPILRPLEGIAHRDALLNADGSEAEWPPADVIVGNPPFLGGSKKRRALGDAVFERLERVYSGRVPAGADLVCYWFEKARAQIESGQAQAAGLVATNSIRQPTNRPVLDRINQSTQIFHAWSDEPWINEGAAVRVSLIVFGNVNAGKNFLNGKSVTGINSDLTDKAVSSSGAELDFTKAVRLIENKIAFQGTKKYGDFDISGDLARSWLKEPNPNGCRNSDVVKPWLNGRSVTGRSSDTWIIDFGTNLPEEQAALYELPFEYISKNVKPYRDTVRREKTRARWWIHEEPRSGLRNAIKDIKRAIATPMTAKHRMFLWLDTCILPDQQLIIIARSDDTTFGILHSRFHELWSLRLCTWLGKGNDPRYTPTTTFETFPFPAGLTPADTKHGTETLDSGAISPIVADELKERARAIANAAHQLNTLRNNWLNPKEWVDWVITPEEQQAGFPSRPIAKPGHETALKQRTLTNLYNKPPAWLINAHCVLDIAVAQAYGWEDCTHELPDDVILQRLLALNLARNA